MLWSRETRAGGQSTRAGGVRTASAWGGSWCGLQGLKKVKRARPYRGAAEHRMSVPEQNEGVARLMGGWPGWTVRTRVG